MEGDQDMASLLKKETCLFPVVGEISSHLKDVCGDLPDVLISDGRYGFAAGLVRECSTKLPAVDRIYFSEKLDSIFTHRILALPIFLLLMYLLFWVVFAVGEIPIQLLEMGFQKLATWLGNVLPPDMFLTSFLVDGLIGGVGSVVVFLPNIILLFAGISLLEDTGYMARVAFIVDRIMHKIGLHGKSFIPMLVGFGCTVPGIMATRTLENPKDRLTTMLVLPLMSCGARFPIYTLIIPAFFTGHIQVLVLWGVYVFGILLAAILAKVLRVSILSGEDTPFVMELPPYRFPTLKGMLHHVWERAWLYLKKAATIILFISIVVWIASYYPRKPFYEADRLAAKSAISKEEHIILRANEQLQYSFLGRLGKTLEPVVSPMGFDWRIATALLGAFTAKEVFVAQMSILFSMGETNSTQESLRARLRKEYSPLVGLCLLIFCLIGTPCMATVVVMNKESGSWGWAMLQFWGLTILAYLVTTLVYQVGRICLR
jgi:ferrous iron transport protein B